MDETRLRADFDRREAVDTQALPWTPSPSPGVERRMLDRIGEEVARATSLVRYAAGGDFAPHVHELGEEFLVLEGVFADEHGDYPAGTYVRNPPGSRHAPQSPEGCVILVKLRQMRPEESQRVVVDSGTGAWRAAGDGLERLALFEDGHEAVALERLAPGAGLPAAELTGGEEIYVLEGELADPAGRYGRGAWLRNPVGRRGPLRSAGGATYWVKRGHLGPPR